MLIILQHGNRFLFIVYKIYTIDSKIINEYSVQLEHYFQIDSISYEFYSYISSLIKIFNIETGIRNLIFNLIISERKRLIITNLLYLFILITVIHERNWILNMSFSSRYVKIFINQIYLSFAKNTLNLKNLLKIIYDIFIINNFHILA